MLTVPLLIIVYINYKYTLYIDKYYRHTHVVYN